MSTTRTHKRRKPYLFIYLFNEVQFLTVYEAISNLFYIISVFSKFNDFCNNSTAYFPC